MLNFIQLTWVPLCLSLVRSLSQQSSEVSSLVKWNESILNCLEFHWRPSSNLKALQSLLPHAGQPLEKWNFPIFEVRKRRNARVWRRCFEIFVFYRFLTMLTAVFIRHLTTFIHLLFKCSNTYFQNTPGHPFGCHINVLAPYVRQWYELLHRWYIQCACQHSA